MLVVLTREAGRNEVLRTWLGDGVTVEEVALTTTIYREPDAVQRDLLALAQYGQFRTLVVTSARSKAYVPMAAAALAPGAAVLSVGPSTTRSVRETGVEVSGEGDGRAVDLDRLIGEGPVLLLGAAEKRADLPDALEARGLEVIRVACYETRRAPLSQDDIGTLRRADVVLIGAPSAWSVARAFVAASTWVVVPGAATGAVVRVDHERVLEQWGPGLADVLSSLRT